MPDRSIDEVMADLDQGLLQDRMELDLGYETADIDPWYLEAAQRAVVTWVDQLPGTSNAEKWLLIREKLAVILAQWHYEKDHAD